MYQLNKTTARDVVGGGGGGGGSVGTEVAV
jgi:hypothetical protein